uniref:Uncharacterized protein n=1 Tax=Glossina palpalis gambiensis TaxID=67801 RepID=A0A1B0BWB3_9MUSC
MHIFADTTMASYAVTNNNLIFASLLFILQFLCSACCCCSAIICNAKYLITFAALLPEETPRRSLFKKKKKGKGEDSQLVWNHTTSALFEGTQLCTLNEYGQKKQAANQMNIGCCPFCIAVKVDSSVLKV